MSTLQDFGGYLGRVFDAKTLIALALLVACASAFAEPMMPAPIGALFFLFLTPPGWIILGALVVAVIVAIVKKAKKRD